MALTPPDGRLVEDGRQQLGRFSAPFAHTNLIDAPYRRLPRFVRRWRLKEWQAVQIAAPTVFANVALFDAKLMQLVQVKIFDRERGEKIVHEWKLRPRAFAIADQLIESTNGYRDRRGSLAFENRLGRVTLDASAGTNASAGTITIDIAVEATRTLPRVGGRIELLCSRGASHVASLPFTGEVGMYSHKGMFPARGELVVGDRTYAFMPSDTLALLDDHKGYYPYVMRWDWVTSAVFRNGHALGFNLTRNQCRDADCYNENCAWQDDRIGLLPAVEFTRESVRSSHERWTIRDREGRVALRFEPTVPGDVSVNALVVHSKYRGPFGRFEGRLEPEGLPPIVVDGWFGMGEDFYLRC